MPPEEIRITDLMRIFLGQVPWRFLIECVFRIACLYLLILVSMRLMGQRMAGQLSRIEMASLVSLAAAVGVPMQAPERGLLPSFLIALVVILIQNGVTSLSVRSRRFERIAQDDEASTLVKDGRLQLASLRKAVLTRERLLGELRSQEIQNLGKVERVYLEANGAFTILQLPEPQPGLSTIPSWDQEFIQQQPKAGGWLACVQCGAVRRETELAPLCPCCGGREWAQAVR